MHPNDPAAPIDPATRRRRARDAVTVVLLAALLLVAAAGDSVRRAGEQMDAGLIKDLVSAAGHPTGWLADQLPVAAAVDHATLSLSPDEDLAGGEGFALAAQPAAAGGDAVAPVTADAFDPRELGAAPPQRRHLRRLLVTGDSMAMPLDAELARRFDSAAGVSTLREPHIGTGISKTALLDWGKLAARQTRTQPDAVVIFLGANEGFPMPARGGGPELECCDAAWAAEYATRARLIMNTYRRNGAARVYWLTLPAPRDTDRAKIARTVNAAIRAAATPYRAHVRVLDTDTIFTPDGRYQDTLTISGQETLIRDADGIHLNQDGATIAADTVTEALLADFVAGG